MTEEEPPQSEARADMIGQAMDAVQAARNAMSVEEMLMIVFVLVVMAFGIGGGISYRKQGKPVFQGVMTGFFAGGILVVLILMIAGALK